MRDLDFPAYDSCIICEELQKKSVKRYYADLDVSDKRFSFLANALHRGGWAPAFRLGGLQRSHDKLALKIAKAVVIVEAGPGLDNRRRACLLPNYPTYVFIILIRKCHLRS